MAIIAPSRQFAFVANPKAASTSIHAALKAIQERPDLDELARPGLFTSGHAPASLIREVLGTATWRSLTTIAVVRNPFDWFASQLTYNRQRRSEPLGLDRTLTAKDVHDLVSILADARGQEWAASGCQSSFLCSQDATVEVSLLLRMDDLPQAWPAILRLANLRSNSRLPRLNHTTHPPWETWLSSDAQAEIAEVYAQDFDLYESTSMP